MRRVRACLLVLFATCFKGCTPPLAREEEGKGTGHPAAWDGSSLSSTPAFCR